MEMKEKLFIASKIYQSILIYFAHWENSFIKKDELDSAYETLVTDILASTTREEFSFLMMEFIAEFNNGHTLFHDPLLEKHPLGFTLDFINEEWLVSSSTISQLTVGNKIISIQQQPIQSLFEQLKRYIVASNEAGRFASFSKFLKLYLPHSYSITYENKDAEIETIVVDRKHTEEFTATDCKWLSSEIAYMKIPSFNHPRFEESAVQHMNEFMAAQTLIIDVRGNSGGSTPIQLVKKLMNKPYRWWSESSPLNIGIFSYEATLRLDNGYYRDANMLWNSPYEQPISDTFTGEVFILVDRHTHSAAEDFTMFFKDNKRATIIGETTKGSTGQPFTYKHDSGIAFYIGTKKAYMPDGTPFEGIGISPDIYVELTREDLYNKHDRILEHAKEKHSLHRN
ncbi:hypothetical protein BAMA_04030 [Bacillus manliponensis]|uniref:Tail specific protease domain-containing protein n=1 Tax=Bacillus manliponensis TaxID=574376 RepID=A0A073K8S3_9BACI|nr:S41 family peptidase [Bacillus manliponensis]KEK18683.1 hypothetical protein BAMA_04030 [Bacillus manliponensis]